MSNPITPVLYLDQTVADFFTDACVVTRSLPSTYVEGVEVPDPAPTTVTILASVQPIKPVDLFRLPEGRRTGDLRVLFSIAPFFGATDGRAADRIVINGNAYEVEGFSYFEELGNYYRTVVRASGRLNATEQ